MQGGGRRFESVTEPCKAPSTHTGVELRASTCAPPDRYNPLRGAAVGPPLEPGTCLVPRRRDHEAGPVRVLPHDRAGARPPPARPAVHDEALALRSGRGGVLPEAGAEGYALLDPDAHVPHLPPRGRVAARRLPARQLAGGGALDGADELHRHERLVLARRQAAPPGLRALRPRPARRRLRARD